VFRAKAARQNCAMVYRDVDAALRFLRRVEECCAELEDEGSFGGSTCTEVV